MRRRPWPALLVATIPILFGGCTTEPNPLSPTADQAPERLAPALREMGEVARRNREAEAAFYRKLAATQRAAAPDANPDRPQTDASTADTREKS